MYRFRNVRFREV